MGFTAIFVSCLGLFSLSPKTRHQSLTLKSSRNKHRGVTKLYFDTRRDAGLLRTAHFHSIPHTKNHYSSKQTQGSDKQSRKGIVSMYLGSDTVFKLRRLPSFKWSFMQIGYRVSAPRLALSVCSLHFDCVSHPISLCRQPLMDVRALIQRLPELLNPLFLVEHSCFLPPVVTVFLSSSIFVNLFSTFHFTCCVTRYLLSAVVSPVHTVGITYASSFCVCVFRSVCKLRFLSLALVLEQRLFLGRS